MKHKNAIVIPENCDLMKAGDAAMVMRGLKCDADVLTSTAADLAVLLERVGKRYSHYYIVGLLFGGDDVQTERVLRALKKSGVVAELVDYCIGTKRGELTRRLHEHGLVEFLTDNGHPQHIIEVISQRFGVDVEDLSFGAIIFENRYCAAFEPGWELIETAKWFRENYGRDEIYTLALCVLARKSAADMWPGALAKAVEHWRIFRKRGLTGSSQSMRDLREKISRIGRFPDARVMILGESGTGKETVAMQLHYGSPRHDKKFVAFNCATVNAELLESRFFGHEEDAYTGAKKRTEGLFVEADGGTLFLDEIGELKLELQGVLLRVLEEGRIMRVGGKDEICVDVRLITATNRDLPAMVREGTFRADLYQRLSVVQIVVPPLRAHKEDIPLIVSGWYSLRLKPNGKCEEEPTEGQVAALMDYDYPGNVRELLNILDRAAMLGEKDWTKLMDEHRRMNRGLSPAPVAELLGESLRLDDAIRHHVKKVHGLCGDNLTKTAEVLGVSRNTARKYL